VTKIYERLCKKIESDEVLGITKGQKDVKAPFMKGLG